MAVLTQPNLDLFVESDNIPQSLKMAGSVASVKYSFLIVSTEQNLAFKNEKITIIIRILWRKIRL